MSKIQRKVCSRCGANNKLIAKKCYNCGKKFGTQLPDLKTGFIIFIILIIIGQFAK
jgi:DNA-directed RNA polymerase subunit RPC12/RpoP